MDNNNADIEHNTKNCYSTIKHPSTDILCLKGGLETTAPAAIGFYLLLIKY